MHPKPMLLILFVTSLLVYASPAHACDPNCAQNFVVGTRYPFLEMNQGGETSITGNADPALAQWVTVRGPCTSGELHGTETFNALIRASYNLTYSTTAPAASTFETRITVYQSGAGTVVGQSITYTRKIHSSIDSNNRQGEWFNSVVTGLPGNTDLDIRLEVRLLASATMTVDFAWVNAQGSPAVYGAGTTMNTTQQVIGGSWVKLADAAFSTAAAGENVDAILQSYMEFVSGNPGDQIMIGLGTDDHSSNGHNSVVYVPASFPDGINGFDNVPNAGYQFTIPADNLTHHFQLWAKNMSGGTTTVRNCQVQGVDFPVSNGYWVDQMGVGQAAVGYTDVSGPITARSDWSYTAQPQPDACLLLDDGRANTQITSCQDTGHTEIPTNGTWTKIATFDMGQHGSTTGYNFVGQGFIEFLGRTSTWGNAWCQIGIENIAEESPIKAVENGMETFSVPINNGQTYFFLDAHRWGTGYGNKINLWVRKVTAGGDQGSYTIGRAYIGGRLVDAGTITCEQ
jgi:hypothetical protein